MGASESAPAAPANAKDDRPTLSDTSAPEATITIAGSPPSSAVSQQQQKPMGEFEVDSCKPTGPVCRARLGERASNAWKVFRAVQFKHEATPLTATVGSLVGLGGLQLIQWLVHLAAPDFDVLIGSTAALATLLFAAPAAPLGRPYNTICGHVISISLALAFHFLQLAVGIELGAHVIAPSIAIGTMTHARVVNPPAAAACYIFLTSSRAQAQPLLGATFLIAPALAGCAWALLVQYGLVRGLALVKKFRGAPVGAKPKSVSVAVNLVDPTVSTCVVQAIEGAQYVNDPLSFLIETLERDRKRLQKQTKAVVQAFQTRRRRKSHMTAAERNEEAAMAIQQAVRKMIALKRAGARAREQRPRPLLEA